MSLFRRLTSFSKKKNTDNVNGKGNSYTNGTKSTSTTNNTNVSQKETVPEKESDEAAGHAVTRADVESTFEQFAQLIHAARRPLPNQSGDGAYLEHDEPTGFWSDMRSLGIKDVKTVRHIMEDKASGKLQDDRKMHMEEIMQVDACTNLTRK